jgi:hypothetical protein
MDRDLDADTLTTPGSPLSPALENFLAGNCHTRVAPMNNSTTRTHKQRGTMHIYTALNNRRFYHFLLFFIFRSRPDGCVVSHQYALHPFLFSRISALYLINEWEGGILTLANNVATTRIPHIRSWAFCSFCPGTYLLFVNFFFFFICGLVFILFLRICTTDTPREFTYWRVKHKKKGNGTRG